MLILQHTQGEPNMTKPHTIEEIVQRLDHLKERYNRSTALDEQRFIGQTYHNVLRLLYNTAPRHTLFFTYAPYTTWYFTHIDSNEDT